MKSLEFMWRGGYTTRYHTERTLREDTVGHHSFNVAAIVMYVRPDASAALLRAALLHDVAEHVLGDIPAPVKRMLPNYMTRDPGGADELVMKTFREVFGELESKLMAEAGIAMPMLSAEEDWVLQFADAADGARYCIHERGMGNRMLDTVCSNFIRYIEELLQKGDAHGYRELNGPELEVFNYIMKEYKNVRK